MPRLYAMMVAIDKLSQLRTVGPMTGSADTEIDRRGQVLTVALTVFGRYGFRKTSMDDVAKAAGISRQGLYLYFSTKEALFREAVKQELDAALAEASRRLDDGQLSTVDRLVGGLDGWFGRLVGTQMARDIGNLLEDNDLQFGDLTSEYIALFATRLAKAISRVSTRTDLERVGVSAEQVAATLLVIGRGTKFEVESRSEFLDKITVAVRLICAGWELP